MVNKHLQLGAINKSTSQLEHPKFASKNENYMCLECKEDIVFKHGLKNIPHFSHKNNSNCGFFNTCNGESECHLKTKSILKHYLELQYNLCFVRNCRGRGCKATKNINIDKEFYNKYPNFTIQLECRFKYNNSNYSADIAMLNSTGGIVFMVEICKTHKTKEERRFGRWVEINATDFIKNFSSDCQTQLENEELKINCIRTSFMCEICIEHKLKFDEELRLKEEAEIQEEIQNKLRLEEEEIQNKLRLEEKKIQNKLRLEEEEIQNKLRLEEESQIMKLRKKEYEKKIKLRNEAEELQIKLNSENIYNSIESKINRRMSIFYCWRYNLENYNDIFQKVTDPFTIENYLISKKKCREEKSKNLYEYNKNNRNNKMFNLECAKIKLKKEKNFIRDEENEESRIRRYLKKK